MSAKEIAETVLAEVYANHVYTPDLETQGMREHWSMHLAVLGETWKDDCDGGAINCALLARIKGIAPELIRLIYCTVETGGGHLVCGIDTDDDTIILDNRHNRILSAAELPEYNFISGMRLSEPGTWRTI